MIDNKPILLLKRFLIYLHKHSPKPSSRKKFWIIEPSIFYILMIHRIYLQIRKILPHKCRRILLIELNFY